MWVHKYKYNWNFFSKDSNELYYFLGFISADGYISDNEIEIGLNEKDIDLLKRFRNIIVPEKPLYYKQKTNSYTLKISCKHFTCYIKEFLGMNTNNKCYELKFPNIPNNFIKDYIRGYVDGDGTIDTTKGYRKDKIYIGPRLRILGNFDFLSKLNETTKKFYNHKTNAINKKGKENIYVITYNFSTAKFLLEWLYKDCSICLERKKIKALSLIN